MKFTWILSLFAVAAVMLPSVTVADYDGVWRTRGYGAVIMISGDEVHIYDETEISFYPVGERILDGSTINLGLNPNEEVYQLERQGDVLTATHRTSRLVLDRIEVLPDIKGTASDPVNVFNVFWQTIEENFASFSLLDLDWNEVRERYSAQVTQNMNDSQLFQLLGDMGAELLDGHTTLANPEKGWFRNTGPRPSLLGDTLSLDVLMNVEHSYIDGGEFSTLPADDRFLYGTLDGGRIGYLAITDFEYRPLEFADGLDEVLAAFADTRALFVDLRHNSGGNNWNGLTLADRLTDRARHVLTRVVRTDGPEEFGAPAEYWTRPAGTRYNDRPVYLLTNDGTPSAGDVTSLMLSRLPSVTQVGEATRGMFSQFTRLLPNGWVMTTSNERFLSLDGRNFEYVGVEPELHVVNTVKALNEGGDEIVEAAITHFNNRQAMPQGSITVTSAMSGNWYTPEHDGEGFILEVIDDNTAVMYWFTYAPGGPGQVWMLGVGEVEGDLISFQNVLQPFGARFGDDFDPGDVVLPHWGDLTLRFSDCNHAVASYSGPDDFGANMLSVQRLTGNYGLTCDGPNPQQINRLSGSWYDPGRSGEGWTIALIDEETAVGLWFTYGQQAEPMWLIGVGYFQSDTVTFDDMLQLTGGRFGPAYDPDSVNLMPWGRVTVESLGCDTLFTAWEPTQNGFISGERNLVRLSRINGLDCPEP